MPMIDFANSYWFFSVRFRDAGEQRRHRYENLARIQLDARCQMVDKAARTSEEFFLITPCRSEWMYRDEDLSQVSNFEYCAIVSREEYMVLRRRHSYQGEQKQARPASEVFAETRLDVRTFAEARLLESNRDIIEATLANLPLLARTEIWDERRHLRAILDYPVKTMNVNRERSLFQVDTRPLIVPDFTATAERKIEWLDPAFVVYDTYDRAEFVACRPTPITADGREDCQVVDYSGIRAMPARNQVFAAAL